MFFRKQQWIYTQIKIQQLQFSLNKVVDLVEHGTPIDLVFLSDGGSGGFEIYIFFIRFNWNCDYCAISVDA